MGKIFWICVDCIDGHNYYQCNECGDYYNDNDTSVTDDELIICDWCIKTEKSESKLLTQLPTF